MDSLKFLTVSPGALPWGRANRAHVACAVADAQPAKSRSMSGVMTALIVCLAQVQDLLPLSLLLDPEVSTRNLDTGLVPGGFHAWDSTASSVDR